MRLIAEAVDYGDAPRIAATGICRVYFLSRNVIRIVWACRSMRDDGVMEHRVTAHLDCDKSELPSIIALLGEGFATLQQTGDVPERAPLRAVN